MPGEDTSGCPPACKHTHVTGTPHLYKHKHLHIHRNKSILEWIWVSHPIGAAGIEIITSDRNIGTPENVQDEEKVQIDIAFDAPIEPLSHIPLPRQPYYRSQDPGHITAII